MHRPSVAIVAVATVLVTSGGCLQARNLLADRDLVCRETPEDMCIRIADLALTRMDVDAAERDVGRIPTIQVYPMPCRDRGDPAPAAVRCWTVEATAPSGAGIGAEIYQQADGSLR